MNTCIYTPYPALKALLTFVHQELAEQLVLFPPAPVPQTIAAPVASQARRAR
jgi:hypothetical protein